MSTIDDLGRAGHTRMRLPFWNEFAYVEPHIVQRDPPLLGPWVKLYDVLAGIGSGYPTPMPTVDCGFYDTWEPVAARHSAGP